MSKKAIIYCRVSTEEQAKEGHHSMSVQENQCKELAKDYSVVKIFRDPGRSGGDSNRPGFLEMIDFIKNNHIDALFVQHTDRLARDIILHHQIKQELQKCNVDLYTVSQGKIESTPEAKMADSMLAAVNEYHKNITAYKTQKAILQKAQQGWLPGEAPHGYKNVGKGLEGRIRVVAIDEKIAHFIIMAYKMFSTGRYSIDELGDILHEKGFRSKRGYKISNSKLNYILKNRFYLGELHWGGIHLKKANHQPIISQELFDAAQRVFTEHNHHACRRRKYSFLLRGFAYCVCGARMTAGKFKSKTKSYYFCTKGKICGESYAPVDDLENKIENLFKKIEFSDEFVNLVLDKVKAGYEEMKQTTNQEKQNLVNKKTALEIKRDKVEEKLLAGIISDEDFTRIRGNLKAEIDSLDNQLTELSQHKELSIDKIQEILYFTRNIYKAYQKASPELKKQYLGLFFDKFIISNRAIKKAVLTPVFDALVIQQKIFYKIQKPSSEKTAFVTSSVPNLYSKSKIRTEWGE